MYAFVQAVFYGHVLVAFIVFLGQNVGQSYGWLLRLCYLTSWRLVM